jgi:hypothetical protein
MDNTKPISKDLLIYTHIFERFDISIAKIAFKKCVKDFNNFELNEEEKICYKNKVDQLMPYKRVLREAIKE